MRLSLLRGVCNVVAIAIDISRCLSGWSAATGVQYVECFDYLLTFVIGFCGTLASSKKTGEMREKDHRDANVRIAIPACGDPGVNFLVKRGNDSRRRTPGPAVGRKLAPSPVSRRSIVNKLSPTATSLVNVRKSVPCRNARSRLLTDFTGRARTLVLLPGCKPYRIRLSVPLLRHPKKCFLSLSPLPSCGVTPILSKVG